MTQICSPFLRFPGLRRLHNWLRADRLFGQSNYELRWGDLLFLPASPPPAPQLHSDLIPLPPPTHPRHLVTKRNCCRQTNLRAVFKRLEGDTRDFSCYIPSPGSTLEAGQHRVSDQEGLLGHGAHDTPTARWEMASAVHVVLVLLGLGVWAASLLSGGGV